MLCPACIVFVRHAHRVRAPTACSYDHRCCQREHASVRFKTCRPPTDATIATIPYPRPVPEPGSTPNTLTVNIESSKREVDRAPVLLIVSMSSDDPTELVTGIH